MSWGLSKLFGTGKKYTETAVAYDQLVTYLGDVYDTVIRSPQAQIKVFESNPYVFRGITLIEKLISSVPIRAYNVKDGKRIEVEHDVLRLLRRPNSLYSGNDFIGKFVLFREVCGNGLIEVVPRENGNEPACMNILYPQKIRVEASDIQAKPIKYTYYSNSGTSRDVDFDNVIHWIGTSLRSDIWGMSQLEVGAKSVSMFKKIEDWNIKIVDEGGKIRGIISIKEILNQNNRDDVVAAINQNLKKARETGGTAVIEGGAQFQKLGITPVDLDHIQAKGQSVDEIAVMLGIDPLLLSRAGGKTYANFEEAIKRLINDRVIPLLKDLINCLQYYFFEYELRLYYRNIKGRDKIELGFDNKDIMRLMKDMKLLWEILEKANFISMNEKRKEAGYNPLDPKKFPYADEPLVPSGMVPFSQVAYGGEAVNG